MAVESRSAIRNAKNARGRGRDSATTPFPKSGASYFRFARFNTFPLYYMRAWHRLDDNEIRTLQVLCNMRCSKWRTKREWREEGTLMRWRARFLEKLWELTAVDRATQKGASSLNKSEFWDALKLRYDWEVPETPSVCVCGDMWITLWYANGSYLSSNAIMNWGIWRRNCLVRYVEPVFARHHRRRVECSGQGPGCTADYSC